MSKNLDNQKIKEETIEGALGKLLKSSNELIVESGVFYDKITSLVSKNSPEFFRKISSLLVSIYSQSQNFNPIILEKLKNSVK